MAITTLLAAPVAIQWGFQSRPRYRGERFFSAYRSHLRRGKFDEAHSRRMVSAAARRRYRFPEPIVGPKLDPPTGKDSSKLLTSLERRRAPLWIMRATKWTLVDRGP
jgi:hypothetical protein